MNEQSKHNASDTILRIAGVILAAAGVLVAFSWWQMPYLHYDWYGNDLNVILHIVTFFLCPVVCVLTFLYAEKNKKLCLAGGAAVLVLVIVSTLVNEGFVPYEGTFAIGLIAILYLISAFLSSRPEKPEKYTLEQLTKKFRTARTAAVISAIAAAFTIIFPKGKEVFSQHMGDDGPGVIEYYYQFTDFGIFLMFMIPVCLVLLVIFATRAGLLHGRMKKLEKL